MKISFKKVWFILLLTAFSVHFANAQSEAQQKYLTGKNLIKEEKYSLAMETFLPLLAETEEHDFEQYSHYFYALAAFKSGRLEEGRLTLKQLKHKFPGWKAMPEADYLLGNILFEQEQYEEALAVLQGLGKEFREDLKTMKVHYLSPLPVDTLKYFQQNFPKDEAVASVLADKMYSIGMSEKDRMLLDYLIEEFDMDEEAFSPPAITSEIKDTYEVAVLFPFMVEHLSADNPKRGNQFLLDMYEGIRLAVDSLNEEGGADIKLYAYDTQKDTAAFKKLLQKPELKQMDLIIGPVYSAHNDILADFVRKHQIVSVNPFSKDPELIRRNRLVYLYEPVTTTLAQTTAEFAGKNFKPQMVKSDILRGNKKVGTEDKLKNKVLIIYGEKEEDSLLAAGFREAISDSAYQAKHKLDSGYNVAAYVRITRDNIDTLRNILDSVQLTESTVIFAPVSDQVVAANIVSNIEIAGVDVPVIGSSDWINFDLIGVEQFMRRNIHVLYPEYVRYNDPEVSHFIHRYFDRTKVYPTTFAMQGFDMMYLFGNMMKKYGTYFGEELQSEGPFNNLLFPGYVYSGSQSNAFVPVVKFDTFALVMLNKPEKPVNGN